MDFKKTIFSIEYYCKTVALNSVIRLRYGLKKGRLKHTYIYLFFIVISILLFSSTISNAQVKPIEPDQNQQQILENAAENSSEDADLTEMVELRAYYASHPLDINSASYEELTRSGLFNELQIQALM